MPDVATLLQWTLITFVVASFVTYFGLQGLLVYVRDEIDKFVGQQLPLALDSLLLIVQSPIDPGDFRRRLHARHLDVTQSPDPSSTLHVVRSFTWAGVGLALALIGVFVLTETVLPHVAGQYLPTDAATSGYVLLSLALITALGCIVTVLVTAAKYDAAVAILKVLMPWLH